MEKQQQGSQHKGNLTYTLSTQYATHENDGIEASLIVDTIEEFAQYRDDFIVITPSVPIEESIYMQVACLQEDPHTIILELRFVYPDQSFKHLSHKTMDKGSVIRMLLDYWGSQKLPDYTTWDDVTAQFT